MFRNSDSSVFGFYKLSDRAFGLEKKYMGSAGYDIRSAYDYVVRAHSKNLVQTDLAFNIPKGVYARIAPRSGLALKHSINVGGGVVDRDYKGSVSVILFNHGDNDFFVNRGDRIAQVIFEKIEEPVVMELNMLNYPPPPSSALERGSRGFGSTGYN